MCLHDYHLTCEISKVHVRTLPLCSDPIFYHFRRSLSSIPQSPNKCTQAVVYPRLNRGYYIKGSHPLSKHAFIEIVNTTKCT